MKIALVALQANQFSPTRGAMTTERQGRPSASPRGRRLAGLGHDVTIYARKDSAVQPARTDLAPGVSLERLPAGPAQPAAGRQVLAAHGPPSASSWPSAGSSHLARHGARPLLDRRPGRPGRARDLEVPVVQTFHSLGRRSPASSATDGPPGGAGGPRGCAWRR